MHGAGAPEGAAPSLSQYFGSESLAPQFSAVDMTSSVNLSVEADHSTANLFPTDPTASLLGKAADLTFSGVPSTTVSSSSALPAASLPDPSTFFDNIAPETLVAPAKSVTPKLSADFLAQSFEGLAVKESPASSEVERRRDAWIPTTDTKKTLLKAQSAPKGSFFPEREVLTMPGLILEEELPDHLQATAVRLLGAAEAASRGVLRPEHVGRDEAGLRELLRTGYLRAALSLTGTLIAALGQGAVGLGRPSKHTPRSLQLWLTRFALMARVRLHKPLLREAEAFGELARPDMFYQFYPEAYGGRAGSLAPFSLRLLLAELPLHAGRPRAALERLHGMLAVIRKMLWNLRSGRTEEGGAELASEQDRAESVRLWAGREARVLHSVVNCAVHMKEYRLAIRTTSRLAEQAGGDAPRRALLSALCRLCLQAGRVPCAERYLERASVLRNNMCPTADVREYADRGLLEVAQGRYREAYDYFAKAAEHEPTNIMVANNSAVCLLYMGRLKEAIAVLQKALHADPERGLHESLLVNLCTLYELESSRTHEKKMNLLRMLCKYKSDTTPDVMECLKLA